MSQIITISGLKLVGSNKPSLSLTHTSELDLQPMPLSVVSNGAEIGLTQAVADNGIVSGTSNASNDHHG